MKLTLIIFLIFTFLKSSFGQADSSSLKLSDFRFFSIWGINTKDTSKDNSYCLLGSGSFRAPRSENSDSLISNWMIQHPNAIVIPICAEGPVWQNKPNSKEIYCWIVDNNDTLNNFLVRYGCFAAKTMARTATWDEMTDQMKKLYTDNKIDHGEMKIFIEKKSYEIFCDQIKTAEQYAYDNRLGIWKDESMRDH